MKNHSWKETALISILHEIENLYNYLPAWALKYISEKLNTPLIQVYGVASYYDAFHLKPRGNHHIRVCKGTACYLRGATQIFEELERELGIKEGETTPDMEYSLETVACIGACGLSPCIMVDKKVIAKLSPKKIKKFFTQGDKK